MLVLSPLFTELGTPDRNTDDYVMMHILNGEAFHILPHSNNDPRAGKYVLRDTGIERYSRTALGETEPCDLKAIDLLTALARGNISIEATSLEGKASPHPMNPKPFLSALYTRGHFHISSGGQTKNYRIQMRLVANDNDHLWAIEQITPEHRGTSILFSKQRTNLSAYELLKALKQKTFKWSVEQSYLFSRYSRGYPA